VHSTKQQRYGNTTDSLKMQSKVIVSDLASSYMQLGGCEVYEKADEISRGVFEMSLNINSPF
jgi:hypothetical protein